MKQDKGDAGRAETSAEEERFFAHLSEQGNMLRRRTSEVGETRRCCNQIVELFANRGVLLAGPFLPLAELGKRELSPEQKERHLSLTAEAARLYMLGERTRREIVKIADELRQREPGIEITFALFGEALKYGAMTTRAIALYYDAKALCEERGDTQVGKALAQGIAALLAGQADVTAKLDALKAEHADHDARTREQGATINDVRNRLPPVLAKAEEAERGEVNTVRAFLRVMTEWGLTERQKKIFALRYKGMTIKAIGKDKEVKLKERQVYNALAEIKAVFLKETGKYPIPSGESASREKVAEGADWAGDVTRPDDLDDLDDLDDGDRDE